MLILTRRAGETIVIGDNITLTIAGVKSHQVRIGINAPKKAPVHREEVVGSHLGWHQSHDLAPKKFDKTK